MGSLRTAPPRAGRGMCALGGVEGSEERGARVETLPELNEAFTGRSEKYYHARLMSQHGDPSRIIPDPFRFAAEARTLEGVGAVADMLRLSDALASSVGQVTWRVEGSMVEGVEAPEPRLRLTVEGELQLCCQRCLGGMAWPVQVDSVLQPVRSGQPIPEDELEDDEVDAIELDGELDVLALVEDEILLALPIAPRHQVCDAPQPEGGTSKESPFAALASLRGSHSAN